MPIFICSRQCTCSTQKTEVNCIRVYKMQTIYSFRSSSQSLAFLDMMYSSRSSTRIGKRGFGGGLVAAGLLMRPFSGYLTRTVVVSSTSNISDVITEHKILNIFSSELKVYFVIQYEGMTNKILSEGSQQDKVKFQDQRFTKFQGNFRPFFDHSC